jgi:hypothetical protein
LQSQQQQYIKKGINLFLFDLHSVWEEGNEWNGMEKRKEKNILSFPLFGSYISERNGMKHSFLPIPSKPQFSLPPKLEEIGGNEILFNEIFTKTHKMLLIYFLKY